MIGDVFGAVRERVSAADAARVYGFIPNWAGFICCPFHEEKTPSLKLYAGDRGWYCYGCREGGDVIALTARLFGLDRMDALRKLNADFSQGLSLDRPQTSQETEETFQRRPRKQRTEKTCSAVSSRKLWRPS